MSTSIKLPVLIVNFKIYGSGIGKKGLALAKIIEDVSHEYSISMIIAPSIPDLAFFAENVDVPIFSQHTDPVALGANTGHISAEHLKEIGVVGSLLNHSEKTIKLNEISQAITSLKKNNLLSVVCAADPLISKAAASLEPWAVAMEPPELIGGDVSVTTRPQVILKTIEKIYEASNKVLPLIGAGVKNASHLKDAFKLGSKGVLLASGITKAKYPKEILEQMAKVMVEF